MPEGFEDFNEVWESINRIFEKATDKAEEGKSGITRKEGSAAKEMLEAITALTRSEVLVGVPKDKAAREGDPVTNASLAYIHEFGSAAHNIPARPFLYPGIKKATPQIIAIMKRGAAAAISNRDVAAAQAILEEVGMAARNRVVREIRDPEPPFVPLQPATIRARLRRTAAGRRKLREIKAGGKQLGMKMPQILTGYAQATWDAASGANMKPLIDTGQLRAAISYVVRRI